MSRRPLRLEEFPDSPYATELCRGATTKPFAPALEAEYTAAHLQRVRWRLRLWAASRHTTARWKTSTRASFNEHQLAGHMRFFDTTQRSMLPLR